MSTDEYTPTDEQVRMGFVAALQWAAEAEGGEVDEAEALAAYDRWLAQHDREVAEKALRDAADEDFNQEPLYDGPHPFDVLNRRADALTVADAPGAPSDPPRKGNGPCNMMHPHGPHRWGDRDVTNLPWTCPGLAPDERLPERFRFSREVYGDVADDATRVLLALTDGGHADQPSDYLRWVSITAAQALAARPAPTVNVADIAAIIDPEAVTLPDANPVPNWWLFDMRDRRRAATDKAVAIIAALGLTVADEGAER